jgi:hypothetical protein
MKRLYAIIIVFGALMPMTILSRAETPISIMQLETLFEKNAVRGDMLYKNKQVVVFGTIKAVWKHWPGYDAQHQGNALQLDNNNHWFTGFSTVAMAQKQEEFLAGINVGDIVTLRCKCLGLDDSKSIDLVQCSPASESETRNPIPLKTPLSLREFAGRYYENEFWGDMLYRGKDVAISGVVSSIGHEHLSLTDAGVGIAEGQENFLAGLNLGDVVTLWCKCKGFGGRVPILTDCVPAFSNPNH